MVGALVTVVLPQITQLLESLNQPLPFYTRWIIAGSELHAHVVVGDGRRRDRGLLRAPRGHPARRGRAAYDRFKLRLPVVGRLVRLIAISRFARTLSTLLAGGLPIIRALDTAGEVAGNTVLAETIDAARLSITEGASVAAPLRASGEFPPLVTHMIEVGEQSGELEAMLGKVADTYEEQVETTVTRLTALLEPFLILDHGRHRAGHHSRDARAAAPDHELARLKEKSHGTLHQRRDGFTLIEIMAVVLIIGLLTTLVGIAIVPQIDKGRVTTARTQIKNLEAALETYRMDNARFPTTEQGLEALINPPPDVRNYQTGRLPARAAHPATIRGATRTSTNRPASTTTTPSTSGRSAPTAPRAATTSTPTSATGSRARTRSQRTRERRRSGPAERARRSR